jgi:hypothetical protein
MGIIGLASNQIWEVDRINPAHRCCRATNKITVDKPLVFKKLSELTDWWDRFSKDHNYPLYCIVMATNADTDIVALVENHRNELDEISGESCCFINFRDYKEPGFLTSHFNIQNTPSGYTP